MTATESSDVSGDLAAAGVEWDLSSLLKDVSTPDELLTQAETIADSLVPLRGQIATLDAAGLADVMTSLAEVQELMSRAGHYGMLSFSENTADPERGALIQRMQEESTTIGTKLLFIDLEFAALDDEAANTLLADDRLAFCAHHLRNTRRNRPHLLTEDQETVLLETSVAGASAWVRLFSELTSAIEVELPDPEATSEDDEAATRTASLEEGLSLLQHPDRDTRASAAAAVTDGLSLIHI